MINKTRLSYGVKRFFLFLLFAIPACNVPFHYFGVRAGFPAVVLSGAFMAICDSLTVDINHMPVVFTEKTATLWFFEMMTIVLIFIIFYFVIYKII
jgi:hypothetical protein